MENIVCDNCSASLNKNAEFCDSCGEWQGLSPSIEELNTGGIRNKKRITTLSNDQLNSPISTFQSPTIPTRTQFPGIRAVVFILILIPIVSGAAFFYNRGTANDIDTEQNQLTVVNDSSTTTRISESTVKLTQKLSKFISNCSSSSEYGKGYSCSNLYDDQESSWQDNSEKCKEGYVIFNFDIPVEIKFFTWQNLMEARGFNRNWKVREIRYSTPDPNYFYTYELSNTNDSQWVEIEDIKTAVFKIEFISSYPSEEYNGSQEFAECAIQEIEIFGYPNSTED